MGDLINLRRARKEKRRKVKETAAAENRIVHGRSAGERRKLETMKAHESARLDAHRRDPGDK